MAILSLFYYNPYDIILRTDACRRRAGRDRSELSWALRGRAAGSGPGVAGLTGTENRPG